VIQETLDGTHHFVGSVTGLPGMPDSQVDVGGWENYPEVHRAADFDSDHDGLPDWWETLRGLNPRSSPADFTDANADPDCDGFTQLDDYLAWLALPRVATERNEPIFIEPGPLTRGFTAAPRYSVSNVVNGDVNVHPQGKWVRFKPENNVVGLAFFELTVTDADGSTMTRTIGVRVTGKKEPKE
jgi:hypothetical protein